MSVLSVHVKENSVCFYQPIVPFEILFIFAGTPDVYCELFRFVYKVKI